MVLSTQSIWRDVGQQPRRKTLEDVAPGRQLLWMAGASILRKFIWDLKMGSMWNNRSAALVGAKAGDKIGANGVASALVFDPDSARVNAAVGVAHRIQLEPASAWVSQE